MRAPTTNNARGAPFRTPFDVRMLPPHLRAGLDRISEIRYDALVLIAEAERKAAAEAAADSATPTDASTTDCSPKGAAAHPLNTGGVDNPLALATTLTPAQTKRATRTRRQAARVAR